jgi:predicted nucleic acid-binding protein
VAELLADTDVFVDHLRGVRELRRARDTISYSVITRAELFAGGAEQETRVERLLAPFRELEVDRETAEQAGRLRREHDILLPDALIAATALLHELVLVTRNTRDFSAIPALELREQPEP